MFTCKNTNRTTYQGLALGTSLEDARNYEQIKVGNKMTLDCGYKVVSPGQSTRVK